MKAYQDASLAPARRAKALLEEMTLAEKVGQINQRLYGFRIYERKCVNGEDTIELSEEFRQEVEKYSGLGVLYGLYRADPWADKDYETGLTGVLSKKAYNQVQRYVLEHSRLGIPVMMSSECPHGHQALDGYLLPVNLLAGATFDPAMVRAAYRVSGRQLQNMGVDFALMSMLDVLRDPRWGRSEECYSEDPYLSARMAEAAVIGMQESGPEVVAKHFANPGQVISVNDNIPDPASFADPVERASAEKALAYMGLKPGIPLTEVAIDKVFIGSCTNSRIEDLRAAAEIAKGRKVAPGVQALVVPGSGPVKAQAEAEGLDKIFIEAGFEWRLPGCSMCLAMNNDRLNPGERCASTSNRNFEGRQGRGGRTHLVSPAMAAAAAVTGHFADIRNIK